MTESAVLRTDSERRTDGGGAPSKPPLQRIWSQHVVLHRSVRAVDQWIDGLGEEDSLDLGVQLLEQLEHVLPEHFALEEQGGYFADVLSIAPQFSSWAAELQAEHSRLIPRLDAILSELRGKVRDRARLLAEIRDFVRCIHEHEAGETELVREAFRGSTLQRSA